MAEHAGEVKPLVVILDEAFGEPGDRVEVEEPLGGAEGLGFGEVEVEFAVDVGEGGGVGEAVYLVHELIDSRFGQLQYLSLTHQVIRTSTGKSVKVVLCTSSSALSSVWQSFIASSSSIMLGLLSPSSCLIDTVDFTDDVRDCDCLRFFAIDDAYI